MPASTDCAAGQHAYCQQASHPSEPCDCDCHMLNPLHWPIVGYTQGSEGEYPVHRHPDTGALHCPCKGFSFRAKCRHMDAYHAGNYRRVELPVQMKPFKCYLHSSKEQMLEIGEKLGLTGEALRMFAYSFGEVVFEAEVNMGTGLVVTKTVDGVPVVLPQS